jgi:hypothetical protein
MNNLNLTAEEYAGSNQVRVGNGTGLSISHIGSTSLFASRHSFILNQLLLVP